MDSQKIDWSKPVVLKLLDLWETRPNLYDPKHALYFHKYAKHDALENITEQWMDLIPNLTQLKVQKKISNLRSQYNHERQKISQKKVSGAGLDDLYVPSLFWFDRISFLDQFIKSRKTKSSIGMETVTDPQPSISRSQTMDNISLAENEEMFTDNSSTSPLSRPLSKKSRKESDASAENLILPEASEAIRSVISSNAARVHSEFSADLNTFGGYVKAELQQLDGTWRDEAKSTIFQILLNNRKKNRQQTE